MQCTHLYIYISPHVEIMSFTIHYLPPCITIDGKTLPIWHVSARFICSCSLYLYNRLKHVSLYIHTYIYIQHYVVYIYIYVYVHICKENTSRKLSRCTLYMYTYWQQSTYLCPSVTTNPYLHIDIALYSVQYPTVSSYAINIPNETSW